MKNEWINLISLPKFNLPLIGVFLCDSRRPSLTIDPRHVWRGYWTLDHIQFFLTHKDMEGLPGWGISSMPGTPRRQHEHDGRYTPVTQPFILTRRIWKDDYDDQMIFGKLRDLKLPDICLTGEENPEKPHPENLCRQGIEPRPAAWQARMLPPAP